MAQTDRFAWLGLLSRALLVGVAGSVVLALAVLAFTMPAAAADNESLQGLRLYGAEGKELGFAPQLQTDVFIDVTGAIARVRVQQRFTNPGDAWVEGIYVFPLPEDSAVDRMRLVYNERVIEGEIQEKAQAKRLYEQAKAAGKGASLLDQQRANVFTTAVANIPPRDTVLVEIEYQQSLLWRDDSYSLRFPMVVAPRYIPGAPAEPASDNSVRQGWAVPTDQVPDADRITPPVAAGAPQDFNPVRLTVELDVGLELAQIDSANHPVIIDNTGSGTYRVTLASGGTVADRDFVLQWQPILSQQPSAALFNETWGDDHYALLMVMPPKTREVLPTVSRELILVVDTSGSMHGDSLVQAKAALHKALQQLRPQDRFNIVQFNSTTQSLFPNAVAVDATTLAEARGYIAGLQADGGTEMLPAMRAALRDEQSDGLLRQIVFMTDGAVGNEQQLFELIAARLGRSRLFTVGIGSAPNALFMRKAAEFGRGTFTYVGSTAEVEAKIGALFTQLSSPVLTDVQLRWYHDDALTVVDQAPRTVPDLYAGEPLVVAVSAAQAPTRVEIVGRLGTKRWSHSVDLHGGGKGSGVHALWARRTIADWMARLVMGESADVVKRAVVDLALDHHLVSRYTSLVAVDRTPSRPQQDQLKSGEVAARLPAGWSAQAVFGRLPSTATDARLYLWAGCALLLLAGLASRRWRNA
ncbi:marine proteobacterial sortase target protein [Thiosocius teredinicola]|uniref:marine proteobacterial sortase target protein n=1 Tax=Thiosocius teredinicola TaxID=1973002 RepID=UPI000990F1F8